MSNNCDVSQAEKVVRESFTHLIIVNSVNFLILCLIVYFFVTRMFKLRERSYFMTIFSVMTVTIVLAAINSGFTYRNSREILEYCQGIGIEPADIVIYRLWLINICIIWLLVVGAFSLFVIKYWLLAK